MEYLDKQIKELEEQQSLLDRQRESLLKKQTSYKELSGQVEAWLNQSNFSTPKELVEAMIDAYQLKINPNRNPGGGRRKRTCVTAEFRNQVNEMLANGLSMNRVAKELDVSYAVIVKIRKGSYNHLKSMGAVKASAA